MSEYIIAYLGGAKMPDNPEEDRAKWMAWIGGLGDAAPGMLQAAPDRHSKLGVTAVTGRHHIPIRRTL